MTMIELKIEDDISLMILLHRDGTINRKGDGSHKIDHNFFMGQHQNNGFKELIDTIDSDFENFLDKVFDIPDKKGKLCSLEITLSDSKKTTGARFLYGSESLGPPPPVTAYVKQALKLTDPWYYKQQKMVHRNNKKWWEVWK